VTSVKETDPFATECLNRNKTPHDIEGNWDVFCGDIPGEMWCCWLDPKKGAYIDCEYHYKPPPKAGL
jgi:hypothetical protein